MKKETTKKRDQQVTDYLENLLTLANDPQYVTNPEKYFFELTTVFNSKTISYREIILVALVGHFLDDSYKAYSGFYDCKPRAIFEGPIKRFCLAHGFPHTKSGPLNIAKASNINEAWSSQRDPKEDAVKVVKLIQLIDSGTNQLRADIGVDLIRKYTSIATEIKKLSVNIEPNEDPLFLSQLCIDMIKGAPDAGNTPQRIAGYLLEAHHESLHTGIVVSGTNDSASTTSTTSKKPGDINEESKDGLIYKVYEITVKHFDLSRIIDSYDCIRIYNKEHNTNINEIIVICRKQDCPKDILSSQYNFCLGTYKYQDTIYYYWDMYEWVTYILQHMIPTARNDFYKKLNEYINDANTHEPVKILWKKLHNRA